MLAAYLALTMTLAAAQPSIPAIAPPDVECQSSPACYSAYLTYRALTAEHGRVGVAQAVKLTILSEYWVVVDPSESIIHYSPGMSVRDFGREAIARNLYAACGNQDAAMCQGNLYHFLAGFEPWLGWDCSKPTCRPNNAAAKWRADKLARWLDYNNRYLNMDVLAIVNYQIADSYGWTRGAQSDRPWQWINRSQPPDRLGSDPCDDAALYVDVRVNSPAYRYAIFYTWAQANR